jgi:hypothetical protein
MNLTSFLPLRRRFPTALVLLTAVGLGLSLLAALLMVGLGRPGGAAVLVTMWLVGSVGLLVQGGVGLLLLRGSRRRRARGQGVRR